MGTSCSTHTGGGYTIWWYDGGVKGSWACPLSPTSPPAAEAIEVAGIVAITGVGAAIILTFVMAPRPDTAPH